MKITTALRRLKEKKSRTSLFNSMGLYKWMSDEKFLRFYYKAQMGKKLSLDDPKTYNEKLQWLKLYDHNPQYPLLVDKYTAKDIVARKIGAEYVVPLIGVYDKFEQIDFEKLPDAFVIKTTHNSGGVYICADKKSGKFVKKNGRHYDLQGLKKDIGKQLKKSHYKRSREWAYKDITPRIIVEQYIGNKVDDFKVMCFAGEPKIVYVESGRLSGTTCDFFDSDFNRLNLRQLDPNSDKVFEKPEFFDEMMDMAKKLSAGFPQVRVDFFKSEGKLYFAELTFYNWGGFAKFEPEQWDRTLGDLLILPQKADKP